MNRTTTPSAVGAPGVATRAKTATPLLSVVLSQYAEDDARAYNPYHHGFRRHVDPAGAEYSPSQKQDAERILDCFETSLTLENDK